MEMMTKRHGPALVVLLALTILSLAADKHAEQSANKQNSPRATVQTLYAAISGARKNPRSIADAVACLDLGGLPADHGDPSRMALQLESVLRAVDLSTETIPDEIAGDLYTVLGPESNHIALRRQADGRWLFDRETVAQIPKMATAARKILQDKNKDAASLNVAPEVSSPRATFRTFLTAYVRGDNERLSAV